ncbi:MAG: leucyl aminopeptidase [Nitrospirae bacterium]|nr:leucyl aminopeptidase [Nitrospirota bacterium]MCL5238608.1 leucyl aminopeptidase [Nitrospirota bacterium]
MDISVRNVADKEVKTGALLLPLFENNPAAFYSDLDYLIGGMIKRVIDSKEFTGKHKQLTLLHVRTINTGRILLVGLGKQSEISAERIRQSGGKAFSYLRDLGISSVAVSSGAFTFKEPPKTSQSPLNGAFYFLEGGLLGLYRFEKYRKPENGKEIKTVTVLGREGDIPLKKLQTTVSAAYLARDLVNTPSNKMTPAALSDVARSIAGRKVKVKVLERKDIEREGMDAYVSVSRGSGESLKFIIMEYKGGKGAPFVLVGKSITFDSGGISLKPSEGMEKMKYDMAGGAAVLAVIDAVAGLGLPLNLVGILPAAENLPGGTASKPGDVVGTIADKTVEIISTDAEGRLTLADSLGYAIKYYKPKGLIDIATLTGACSIALGAEAIAMMGTGTELMERLKKASEETYERVWQMPLYDEYREYIRSDVADLKNAGGRGGSLVTAGYFLREFSGDTPWVHLDIAGTAWNDKDKPYQPKGASGIGVRLILSFLEGLCSSGNG